MKNIMQNIKLRPKSFQIFIMLKDPNTPVFEEKWPSMRPTILKLLRQEAVSKTEWHDLFWLVHSVCLWDDKVGFLRLSTLQ